MTRPLTALLALLVTAAAMGACGNDDEEPTSGATGATGARSVAAGAADADARAAARAAQVALETYAVENNGSYTGADENRLAELEPGLADADIDVTSDALTYEVEVTSSSGATYSATRHEDGAVERTCAPAGTGGCSAAGKWD